MFCHCGNVTAIGERVPMSNDLDGHCLLCRCDEHSRRKHNHATDEGPGCGPMCTRAA